jgi:hypothetical protein
VTRIAIGQPRPRRLGARTRKGFLMVHIASAGAWIGIDVVMGVLIFTALVTDSVRTTSVCDVGHPVPGGR